MTKRIFNFSAGPATLPLEVLEEARDEFAATACICCGVGYLTLERRGGEGPDYTPYCQYCVWAEVGLVCRGCCRGGAGHPCGT